MSNERPEYKLFLYKVGTKIAELVDYTVLKYGYERNNYVEFSFDHLGANQPTEIQQYLATGGEIRIERKGIGEEDFRLVYAGEITRRGRSIKGKAPKFYTIMGKPWLHLLESAYISGTFGTYDEATIAWNIINTIQTTTSSNFSAEAVDYGIQQGTLETTGNTRNWTYDDEEVLGVLQRLADLEDQVTAGRIRGFRLAPDLLDPAYLYFSYYGTFGVTRPNVIYTNELIEDIEVFESIEDFANVVNVIGRNGDIETAESDDTIQNEIKKRREIFLSKSNIETLSVLADAAAEEVITRSQVDEVIEIQTVVNDPLIGSYRVGDVIAVNYTSLDEDGNPDNFLDVSTTAKVYKIEIEYDSKGRETAKLVLATNKPSKIVSDPIARLKELFKTINNRLINAER